MAAEQDKKGQTAAQERRERGKKEAVDSLLPSRRMDRSLMGRLPREEGEEEDAGDTGRSD